MTNGSAAGEAAALAWAPDGVLRPGVPCVRVAAEYVGCCVPRTRNRGSVHSVFRQACNIETAGGALITLLAPSAGNLPHGIRCRFGWPSNLEALLRPGQTVVASATTLQAPEAALVIDLSGSRPWSGEIAQHRIYARSTHIQHRLSTVRSILEVQADEGFAPILLRGAGQSSPLRDAMAGRLAHCLPRLAIAGAAWDAEGMAQALAPLVGLGPGLTPSGDDFIIGYLAALWCQAGRDAQLGSLLHALASPLHRLATHTNAISRQFIVNAVMGQFSERLVGVVRALAQPDLDIRARTAEALRTGHSSGADSLVGLLFGLRPEWIPSPGIPSARS